MNSEQAMIDEPFSPGHWHSDLYKFKQVQPVLTQRQVLKIFSHQNAARFDEF